MLYNEVWTMLIVEGIKDGKDKEKDILQVGCIWEMKEGKETCFSVACRFVILQIFKGTNKEGATGFRRSMTSGLDDDFWEVCVHLEVRNKEISVWVRSTQV